MSRRTGFPARATSLCIVLALVAGAFVWLMWPVRTDPTAPAPSARAEALGATAGARTETVELATEELPNAVSDRRIVPVTHAPQASESPEPVEKIEAGETIARLRVLVRANEDGAPQVGVRVGATYRTAERVKFRIQDSHGGFPETDVEGRVELEVEPGRPLDVRVYDARMREQQREIAALAAGETLELVFEFPTSEDVRLLGQLVAAEDGAPLYGSVKIVDGTAEGRIIETDGAGRFEITAGSWDHAFAGAEAEGRALAVFPIAEGHADRSRPRIVRLSRAATVEAFVSDPTGAPVSGASIELRCGMNRLVQGTSLLIDLTPADDPLWSAMTDSAGHATIEGLPPNVPLQVSVSKSGLPPRVEPEPIRLGVGERRQLDLLLGGGATILGSLEDETGAPILRRVVWRMPAEKSVLGMFQAFSEPIEKTKTDAQGNFRFDAVPAGTWWIGPAPVHQSDLPAVAHVVTITDEQDEIELVVQVERGLYLRGLVLDPLGFPAGGSWLRAELMGSGARVSAEAQADGSFSIGPLAPGQWNVEASGLDETQADSLSVEAESGSTDIVLSLRAGGQIFGEVVDALTGELCECQIGWGRADAKLDDPGEFWTMRHSSEGILRLGRLLPGTYVVTARTRNGKTATRKDIEVESGAIVDEIRLELVPGAKLDLLYEGTAPYVHCKVILAGTVVDFVSFETGKIETLVLPAGALELHWSESSSPTEYVEPVMLEAGEELRVTLGNGSAR